MDIQIDCKSAVITPASNREVSVEIEGAEIQDILHHFTVEQIVDHFKTNELLDAIGQDEAEKHFDLIPNEPE